jgi:hypothetical protein
MIDRPAPILVSGEASPIYLNCLVTFITRHSIHRSSRRPYNFEMFLRCLTQVNGEPEEDDSHGPL